MIRQIRASLHIFSPVQILLLGFIALAVLGALVLMLPSANVNGLGQPFLDALFMSTSAVTTTGLGVVNTDAQYTIFGELVILSLIQIGGLGYMTLFAFIAYLFGANLSLRGQGLMEESLALPSRGEMRGFIRRVVNFTIFFEVIGALALTFIWLDEFPPLRALYLGLFHAISAFCTAGFALFDYGFIAYRDDTAFNSIINFISISGAIGFVIWGEAWLALKKWWLGRLHYLSVHGKLALLVSGLLVLFGTAVLLLPRNNLGPYPVQPALFQAVTAVSTTGFNSVAISDLSNNGLMVLMLLMFIGAPAGGTGGGIKSTTFGVMLLFIWSFMKGHKDVNIFNRRLTRPTLIKSMGIGLTAVFWLVIIMLILTFTESMSFIEILFEAVSALGTVGLSMGITAELSSVGKWVIILTMIIGRVGPLTLAFTLFRNPQPASFRYPREEVFVG